MKQRLCEREQWQLVSSEAIGRLDFLWRGEVSSGVQELHILMHIFMYLLTISLWQIQICRGFWIFSMHCFPFVSVPFPLFTGPSNPGLAKSLFTRPRKPVWTILSQTPAFGKQNCQCKAYMSTQNIQGFLSFLFLYRRYEWQPYYALKKRFNILTFRCPMNKIWIGLMFSHMGILKTDNHFKIKYSSRNCITLRSLSHIAVFSVSWVISEPVHPIAFSLLAPSERMNRHSCLIFRCRAKFKKEICTI